MITVRTLKGNAQNVSQYLQDSHKQLEQYYTAGTQEIPEIEQGIYFGGDSLGLGGKTVGPEFEKILDGRKPDGKPLYQKGHDGRRLGFDITFSPDKSLSLLWARGIEPERRKIESLVEKSVKETLTYAKKHVLNDCVRRGAGGKTREAPKDLTFALFQHGTSRLQDPQLHVHCILMNAAERKDGSWGAIEGKALFERQKELRAVFDNSLSYHLERELGVACIKTPDGFRIQGIPEKVIVAFSKRREEIEEFAQEKGLTTQQAGNQIALITRQEKTMADRDLIQDWQKQFDDLGFSHSYAKSLYQNRSPRRNVTEQEKEKAIESSLLRIEQRTTVFRDTDLKSGFISDLMGRWSTPELSSFLEQGLSSERIKAVPEKTNTFTTDAIQERIDETKTLMVELNQRFSKVVEDTQVTAILEQFVERGMSQEQKKVAEGLLKGPDFQVVVGAAGTGKSVSLEAVREGFEGEGYRVRGLAPTGKAAQGLQDSSGIPSMTLHKFTYGLEKGTEFLKAKDVLIVDEAGMIGQERMETLLKATQESGAKLVLVGDHKQLQPIDYGKPFEDATVTVEPLELTQVWRQKVEWQKAAAEEVRAWTVRGGLIAYEGQGRVFHSESFEKSCERIVEDYRKDRSLGCSQLVLAPTNELVEKLNLSLRHALIEDGAIHNKGSISIPIENQKKENVQRSFSPGDQIVFLKNDYKVGVRNGDTATISHIERVERGVFRIKADMGQDKSVSFKTDSYHSFDYGYAVTIHKSQGATADKSYVVVSKDMGPQGFYVALSRHQQDAQIYSSSELVYEYRKSFETEVPTDRQAKLHIESLAQNISPHRNVSLESSLKRGESKDLTNQPSQSVVYTTEKHIEFCEKLSSPNRNDITQALYDIATKPKGLETKYSEFDLKKTDYQNKAAEILKTHDYSRENLQELRSLIESKPIGIEPTLIPSESQTHYNSVKDCVNLREKALVFNTEASTQFMTHEQKDILKKILESKTPRAQLDLAQRLGNTPFAVGKDFGQAQDPYWLHSSLRDALDSYSFNSFKDWAKEVLQEPAKIGVGGSQPDTPLKISLSQAIHAEKQNQMKILNIDKDRNTQSKQHSLFRDELEHDF